MTKPNIIFLHGGPGFSNYLRPFFNDLGDSVNAIFYDQLKGDGVSMDDLIDQLDGHVKSLEGSVYLVGHSWGGTLGLEYVTHFENKIAGIVLMSTGLSFKNWKKDFDLEKEKRGLTNASPEMIFLSERERDGWASFLDGMEDTFSEETFHSLYDGYITGHDHTQKFSQLNLPVLIISGSDDVRFNPQVAKSMGEVNPRAEVIEVKGAGHFPFLLDEHRKMVNTKIIEFMM